MWSWICFMNSIVKYVLLWNSRHDYVIMEYAHWWILLGVTIMLPSSCSLCNSVEYRAPLDYNNDSPMLKWLAVTSPGILQLMVDPTRPDGLELPTFSYGCERIPRVVKQCRFSPHRYIFHPRDAYMHHWPGSPLTQVMALCLLGAKPLPEPMFIL